MRRLVIVQLVAVVWRLVFAWRVVVIFRLVDMVSGCLTNASHLVVA